MDSNVTMDAIITFLGQTGASTPPEAAELTKAAVNILFAISEEGAKTAEDALDILHDYRLQAKQYAALQQKHLTALRQALPEGRRVALPGLQWTVQAQQFLLPPLREEAGLEVIRNAGQRRMAGHPRFRRMVSNQH